MPSESSLVLLSTEVAALFTACDESWRVALRLRVYGTCSSEGQALELLSMSAPCLSPAFISSRM